MISALLEHTSEFYQALKTEFKPDLSKEQAHAYLKSLKSDEFEQLCLTALTVPPTFTPKNARLEDITGRNIALKRAQKLAPDWIEMRALVDQGFRLNSPNMWLEFFKQREKADGHHLRRVLRAIFDGSDSLKVHAMDLSSSNARFYGLSFQMGLLASSLGNDFTEAMTGFIPVGVNITAKEIQKTPRQKPESFDDLLHSLRGFYPGERNKNNPGLFDMLAEKGAFTAEKPEGPHKCPAVHLARIGFGAFGKVLEDDTFIEDLRTRIDRTHPKFVKV